MNIEVNTINFTGKKEVLYALTKAAQKAKDIECYNQSAIAACDMKSKIELQAIKEASMKAYLDMAIRDSEFKNVVKNATDKDLVYIKNILAPEQAGHSFVEPMKQFREVINSVVYNNYSSMAQESMTYFTNKLLEKLKL